MRYSCAGSLATGCFTFKRFEVIHSMKTRGPAQALTAGNDDRSPLVFVVPQLGATAEEGCHHSQQGSQHHAQGTPHDLPGFVARASDCLQRSLSCLKPIPKKAGAAAGLVEMELRQSRHISPRMGDRRFKECTYRDGASCGRHTRGVAGYGVPMRGTGGLFHSALCMQPCQAHQIDEKCVASDGNHVVKAGCCHHGDRNCCSQGASILAAFLSKS